MTRTMDDATLRQMRTLFGAGTSRGLSDGELLERFAARDGKGAEEAFASLVERHGPMVLRVARSVLRDRHAADDAFQAAFLALARRAGSLWVRDSIGPWLHAVTVRIASRMRADLARRRLIDERAACLAPTSFEPAGPDDLGAALHEEIARLPDRHRLPIVLCLVEGLTHDEAARRLSWPVGTVRSRLARGRDRLRDRLDRRGLSPSAMPIGLALARSAPDAVRASLLSATARLAVSVSHGGLIAATGTVPAVAVAAAIGVLKEMTMIHRATLVVGLVAAGVLAAGASLSAQSKPEPSPDPAPSATALERSDGETSITRIYQVADLVASGRTMLRPSVGGSESSPAKLSGLPDFKPLVDLLTDSVAPGSWNVVEILGGEYPEIQGGENPGDYELEDSQVPGSLRAIPVKSILIISHSPEVHDEVATRLQQLRRIVGTLTGTPGEDELRLYNLKIPAEGDRGGDRTSTKPLFFYEEKLDARMEEKLKRDPTRGPGDPAQLTPKVDPFAVEGKIVEQPVVTNPLARSPDEASQGDRIEALERKLDAILEELQAIRKADRPEGLHTRPDSGLRP